MSTAEPSSCTAVIADDERLLREQLRARLAEVWPELEIVGEAKNGTEAVELVEENRNTGAHNRMSWVSSAE